MTPLNEVTYRLFRWFKRRSHFNGSMGYHAYSRWLEILPYSSGQMNIIFNYGWLGVHLFFLISGFVIFLTLDKSSNFITFMFKRSA